MVLPFISRILRLVSIVVCAIAVLWFGTFVIDQTKSASSRQQAEVNAAGPAETSTSTPSSGAKHESGAHEALDKAFSTLASPFSSVTAGSGDAWSTHIVETLLVLAVYGFGLGFLARLLRLGL